MGVNMARQKKENEKILEGYKSEDKLLVQKSIPLFSLWRSSITLSEFKILDIYLARINSHDSNKSTVKFEKGEIEKILGVKRIDKDQLKERLTNLMSRVVELPALDEDASEDFNLITLFEIAEARKDKNTGLWNIELKSSEKAVKYFFNVENIGYVRYKLRCVTCLTSRYSYIMFTYLEHNRFRKKWDKKLEDLRIILNCNDSTYQEFKYFNRYILKKVHKEINDKTDCKYTYSTIKKGRVVIAIHFELETLNESNIIDVDDNYKISEIKNEEPELAETENLWEEPLKSLHLKKEQLDEIFSIMATIPTNKLPESSVCPGSVELMRYHYIDQKVKEIERRDKQRKITNKYAYLLKMLKNDTEKQNVC